HLDKAQLEPELISSVTGRERAKRRVIGFNDVSENLRNAIVVTEDRSFFEHHGVNIRGIIRALLRRYDSDPNSPIARQGGSSITQQLVKNLLLSPEYSLKRKVSEAYMSVILETRLSKQEIFALYCNQVYLGQQAGFGINGFGEASSAYFNKDVTNLSLSESAFLAGIIRSPNRYNPFHDLATARSSRNQAPYSNPSSMLPRLTLPTIQCQGSSHRRASSRTSRRHSLMTIRNTHPATWVTSIRCSP